MQQVLGNPETAALILRYMGHSLANAMLATSMFARAISPAFAKGDWLRCSYDPEECMRFSIVKMRDFQVALWLLDNLYDNDEARGHAACYVLRLAAAMPDLLVEHSVVQMLVAKGGDVNMQYHNGMSALHLATTCGHWQLVRSLLALGASVASCCKEGQTPLHVAALNGQMGVAELLLNAGADIEATILVHAHKGATPLWTAVLSGHQGVAELLLARGANIEAATSMGYTPLHSAAYKGNVEAVRLLLANGARRDAAALDGLTPLSMAEKRGRGEVLALLRPAAYSSMLD